MRVYVASPLGFSEAWRMFYADRLLPAVRAAGHEPVDPWALTSGAEIAAVAGMPEGPARRAAWRGLNERVAARNADAIDSCDAVLAVLDGTDVDSGTAAEVGYACARGKPVVGYRGDARTAGDNEGSAVNLQVEYFIRRTGGDLFTSLEAAIARIGRNNNARVSR